MRYQRRPSTRGARIVELGSITNFFLADVPFFRSPPASDLLKAIDVSKTIFTHRTGDLVIQSAIVRLFARPEEVRWFRDFDYEHMTLCRKDKCGMLVRKGCVYLLISRRVVARRSASHRRRWMLVRSFCVPSPPSPGAPRTAAWPAAPASIPTTNGGIARGGRSSIGSRDNPRPCNIPVNTEVVGADDVRMCMKIDSRCGAYLRQVSGGHGSMTLAAANGTA